ncbi:MAG: hypothetical protein AAFV49_20760 [Pseudomonadota bacterium]
MAMRPRSFILWGMIWLLDPRIPFAPKLNALRLARIRLRIWWMRLDPWLLATAVAVIVLLRIGLRALGIDTNPANLLASTAFVMLGLAAALGALTKRSDRREARVMERVLRMQGYRLARGRLERARGR